MIKSIFQFFHCQRTYDYPLSHKSISRYITSRYLVLLTRFYITSKRTYAIKRFTWCRVQKQHLNKFNLHRRHDPQQHICLPPPIYISLWHNNKTNRSTCNHNWYNTSISKRRTWNAPRNISKRWINTQKPPGAIHLRPFGVNAFEKSTCLYVIADIDQFDLI